MSRLLAVILAVAIYAGAAAAQQPTDSMASAFRLAPAHAAALDRGRRLVNEGRGAAGRAVIDSVAAAVDSATPAYATVLLARAMAAADARSSERDLRRIVVEHAFTAPAETALVRLAQIEMQRGDRTAALRHLERLMAEFSTAGARARGAFWAARVHRDGGDETRACGALANARSWAPAGDIELINQIEYAANRCPTPLPVAQATMHVDTAAVRATTDSARPSPAVSAPAVSAPIAAPATPPPDTSRRTFSVQVAAYSRLADARKAAETFTQRGYPARVDGMVAPFRVRVGRYGTREEAARVAADLKKISGAAFVVLADPR